MTIIESMHEKAMKLTDEAFEMARQGNSDGAKKQFWQAIERERRAAQQADSEPTRSILYRGAESLAFHAEEFGDALQLIQEGLNGNPSLEIESELIELRTQIEQQHDILRKVIIVVGQALQKDSTIAVEGIRWVEDGDEGKVVMVFPVNMKSSDVLVDALQNAGLAVRRVRYAPDEVNPEGWYDLNIFIKGENA
jgi:hypothetical protein